MCAQPMKGGGRERVIEEWESQECQAGESDAGGRDGWARNLSWNAMSTSKCGDAQNVLRSVQVTLVFDVCLL